MQNEKKRFYFQTSCHSFDAIEFRGKLKKSALKSLFAGLKCENVLGASKNTKKKLFILLVELICKQKFMFFLTNPVNFP